MKARLLMFAGTIALAAACGARSGLPLPAPAPDGGTGAGGSLPDAGPDAPPDAPPDVFDAPPDVPPDVPIVTSCDDAGVTYIYVVSADQVLYSFYPPTNQFTFIGQLSCPDMGNPMSAFSMAVDRRGIAYVEYYDGQLFLVDTKTASCQATNFLSQQQGFNQFGMGFSANVSDPGETLFIAADTTSPGGKLPALGTIDVSTFNVMKVGQLSAPIGNAELTGTGDGQLYGFGVDPMKPVAHLAHIDKVTAKVLDDTVLPFPLQVQDWAFAYWGGDFYFFTSVDQATTTITRYRPSDKSLVPVMTLDHAIVGAGVSTCAPQ